MPAGTDRKWAECDFWGQYERLWQGDSVFHDSGNFFGVHGPLAGSACAAVKDQSGQYGAEWNLQGLSRAGRKVSFALLAVNGWALLGLSE
ncbi:MAG: hypothetical protein CL917_03155 [Deltaproteobacteria bacterium]|nr:hypothetical protein [Deltaproteobacteria bacterium]